MKVFVTGVAGQLGHDVMNELALRGYIGVGTDLAESYSGIQDGTYVTTAEYVSLDITDKSAVMNTIKSIKPDVVVHCAAWTAVDLAEDEDKQEKVKRLMWMVHKILPMLVKRLMRKWSIFLRIMYLMVKEQRLGNQIVRIISH